MPRLVVFGLALALIACTQQGGQEAVVAAQPAMRRPSHPRPARPIFAMSQCPARPIPAMMRSTHPSPARRPPPRCAAGAPRAQPRDEAVLPPTTPLRPPLGGSGVRVSMGGKVYPTSAAACADTASASSVATMRGFGRCLAIRPGPPSPVTNVPSPRASRSRSRSGDRWPSARRHRARGRGPPRRPLTARRVPWRGWPMSCAGRVTSRHGRPIGRPALSSPGRTTSRGTAGRLVVAQELGAGELGGVPAMGPAVLVAFDQGPRPIRRVGSKPPAGRRSRTTWPLTRSNRTTRENADPSAVARHRARISSSVSTRSAALWRAHRGPQAGGRVLLDQVEVKAYPGC